MRQQCRPEHQKGQRENGHYAFSLGFPEAGETNDKSGVLHNVSLSVGTKAYGFKPRVNGMVLSVSESACPRSPRSPRSFQA